MPADRLSPVERDLLRGVPLFQGIAPAELASVLDAARPRRVRRGGAFFREGERATAFYVVVAGRVKLTQLAPDGHRVTLRLIGPGDAFGGVALSGESTYPVTAVAVTDCAALLWDGATMARLMRLFPGIALNALDFMAKRVQELQARIRELATERVERRIARALVRLVRQAGTKVEGGVAIDFPVSRQDLAEMAGTTLYTASRVLSGWQAEGIVATRKQRVVIRAPHRLTAIAEEL
jgi:CRP-like cAMP-binding protein